MTRFYSEIDKSGRTPSDRASVKKKMGKRGEKEEKIERAKIRLRPAVIELSHVSAPDG